ncbi:MAG: alpha/beta hydrolase [Verrucomicrobiaceae bacterium]
MTSLHLTALFLALTLLPTQAAEPIRDIKYDTKHERNVLDLWPALSKDKPAPVYVFFHGGGFRNGDKTQLEKNRRETIDTFRNAGFAVISCNYPFLDKKTDHRQIANHCARAVQFIRSQSKEWNIDPKRLCCGGVSAGALISEFLGYHDDFADPKSSDPVTRQSSRPAVVASIMQPIGTRDFALRFMDKGEAPLFIYTNARPTDRIHPPAQAIAIRDKAKSLNIPCLCYGGGRNALPQPPQDKTWLDHKLAFFLKHLPKEK